MTIDMSKHGGRRKEGRDYSKALREMLPEIMATPKTRWQIAKEAERDFETVSRCLERMRDQIHIAGWVRGKSGPITALWLFGAGDDAPKPAPLTQAEKSARWRSTPDGRKKQNQCARNWRNSENGRIACKSYRTRRYARKKFESGGVAAIDPLLAAVMGVR